MNKTIVFIVLFLMYTSLIISQNFITGFILDAKTSLPLENTIIRIDKLNLEVKTDNRGYFKIKDIPNGVYFLEILLDSYEHKKYPIEIFNSNIELGRIFLNSSVREFDYTDIISLTDDELNTDSNSADNISGLLLSSKDIFLKTAAFEFSSSFFRPRGLDSRYSKILINGIEMNKLQDGRAQWSNWGGLNDVLRNQEYNNGLLSSNVSFGSVLGVTNITTKASEYRKGTRISYASSNRSYVHRLMATYASGVLKNNWAFTFSGSKRSGIEGFNEGTSYNAHSLFIAAEKIINNNHSVNFTTFFAPNRRGKSSANTQEVFDLKGIDYNEYWGYLNGKKINSRIKEVVEPILILNHYWDITKGTSLQTNISYQFGKIGNSRLDFNSGANPSATYWQLLPSFFLKDNDLAGAYKARANFENNGQLNWNRIFDANSVNNSLGLENSYVLYEDRVDERQLNLNTIFKKTINENILFNAKVSYSNLFSDSFAEIIDLLGGTKYLDVNNFADTEILRQNNVLTPNRFVGVGDKFRYHYTLNSSISKAFTQGQFNFNKIDFYTAASLSNTTYQREGIFKNGRFQNNSLGKSEKVNFLNYGFKVGGTYKITGRHLVDFNAAYLTQAPSLRNTFSNVRENNNIVEAIKSEKITATDVSYILRTPKVTSKITSYFIDTNDVTELSFFFADGIGGDNTAFVQEILSGIDKRQFGLEFGVTLDIIPTIKLKGVASIGQFIYTNNPNLYLTTDVVNEGVFDDKGRSKNYIANLKNYKLATGPQNAYSVGFEYRDPDYWWIGATSNFFSNTYVDISPLTRSANFYEDTDGLPFFDFDNNIARELLKQERFDNYMTINLVGGKSWKINDNYISVFASVNNLLNKEYRTGGFEQGRNANYRQLIEDKSLDIPVFGNKYWYGRGTTYFVNLSYRF